MAARKKRAKPEAAIKKPKASVKLDDGWKTFIGEALKKRPRQALWPDPAGEEKRKPHVTKKVK
jgi:hypothetical protein